MQLLLIGMDAAAPGWLAERLSEAGFVMRLAHSPEEVLRDGLADGVGAIIVDIGLAGPKASVIMEFLRKAGLCQPLMVLAAHGDWRDKVDCLDAGADEYLVKPVRTEEIAARLRTILRRCAGSPTNQITVGDLQLDLKAKCAWLAGECLNLTRNEFRLLRLFLLRPEHVMSHQEIKGQLYPGEDGGSLNAIEVQIARLRRKVGQDRIRTVRGIGYRYVIGDNSPYTGALPQQRPCKAIHAEDRMCMQSPVRQGMHSDLPDHQAVLQTGNDREEAF